MKIKFFGFLLLLILYFFSCTKKEKIEFIKWNTALVEKNASKIAGSEIAGYNRAVFQSLHNIEKLKKEYLNNGYLEKENNILTKENIKIRLIDIEGKKTNIVIEITP